MPVAGARGTVVLPSEDTHTPTVPVPADVLLTPDDFDIPVCRHATLCLPPFTPDKFARRFGKSARTIIREIEDGHLRALRVRGEYSIPWIEVVFYFMRQQGADN